MNLILRGKLLNLYKNSGFDRFSMILYMKHLSSKRGIALSMQYRDCSSITATNKSENDKPLVNKAGEEKPTTRKSKTLRAKTPIGKLDELEEGRHPYQEKEPLPPWPDNTNPHTGEIGGPRGPEPTRYGDWERKGRVSDF